MSDPLEVPTTTGTKRFLSGTLLSPTKRARSASNASASSVESERSDISADGGVSIDPSRQKEPEDFARMREKFFRAMQLGHQCDPNEPCGDGSTLMSDMSQNVLAGFAPAIVLTDFGNDSTQVPLSGTQSPFDAVLQGTLARLHHGQGVGSSAEARDSKRCSLYKAYLDSRFSMWSAQDRCSLAIEAANSLIAPFDESATWTAEDSRRLVETLQQRGMMRPIRAAWTELVRARVAYKTAAPTTASIAFDIFLAGPDSAMTQSLEQKKIGNYDEQQVTREALEMSRSRNLEHVRSLTREVLEVGKLYETRSQPFIKRFGHPGPRPANSTGSSAAAQSSQSVASET